MKEPFVLVVDDDVDLLKMLELRLGAKNYRIATACDGAEGLAVFRRRRPDLVLMDICMPQLDGLAVLREMIQNDPSLSVVVVSGACSGRQARLVLEEGASCFVAKPIDFALLDETMDFYLPAR